ncbi:hypothetical protein BDF22DRAFT_745139 [Syncephalis plumigaleata]|nr:hypothetical protein BDF22DRAFT_745139 [Syncephalis plumigaleata]
MNRREPEEQPAALPPRTPTDARRITVQSTIDGNHNNNDDPIYSSDTSSFSSDHSLAGSSPAGAQSIFNVSEGMEIINSGIISIEELNEERLQRAIEESVLLDSIEQQLADRRRSLLMQSLQTEAISSDAIIDNANTPHTHASNDDGEGEELESAFEGAFFNNEHPSSSSSSADEVVVDSTSVIEEQAESAGVASDDSWSDLDG